MRILIQRVSRAKVVIGKQTYSKIENGLVVFVGVFRDDIVESAEWLAKKTLNIRIFSDRNNRMNRSILDCRHELLVVSQFTLAADCDRGNRPSFTTAADPEQARIIYETLGCTSCAGGACPPRPPISMLKKRPRAEAPKWTKVLRVRTRLAACAQH